MRYLIAAVMGLASSAMADQVSAVRYLEIWNENGYTIEYGPITELGEWYQNGSLCSGFIAHDSMISTNGATSWNLTGIESNGCGGLTWIAVHLQFDAPRTISLDWELQDNSASGGAVSHMVAFTSDDLAHSYGSLDVPAGEYELDVYIEPQEISGQYGSGILQGYMAVEPLDCNDNGVPDSEDIASGLLTDCNGNGYPDSCEIASGLSPDCNDNGVPDSCDNDCNLNGIPDTCDLASGDEADCNENGLPDSCDIDSGSSTDVNLNEIPDECECLGDVTFDGTVNVTDMLTVIATWGTTGPFGDANFDGTVDIADLLFVLSAWGPCP